jgi:His/Glu/Gln/Arg/opine family amino acid ABC transporter permease subunit
MDVVIAYMPSILKGTWITVAVALASVLLSVVLGLLGAWGKLAKLAAANRLADAYTTLIRGVPDLVLMLLLFFSIPRGEVEAGFACGMNGGRSVVDIPLRRRKRTRLRPKQCSIQKRSRGQSNSPALEFTTSTCRSFATTSSTACRSTLRRG